MSSTEIDTNSRILAETWRLMEQKRGQGVRIQDIAKAAGISRQAVYLHFPSRVELLVETTRYVDKALCVNERFQEYCAAKNGVERLEGYVDFWGNYIPQIYGLAKALMVAQETDEDAATAWQLRMKDVRDGCCSVIDELVREKALAPQWTTTEAVDMMWTLLMIPNWENLTLRCGWSQEQYIQWMKATLKRLLVGGK